MLTLKTLIGFDVETETGKLLGQVRDIEVGENLTVKNIYVKPHGLVKGLVSGDLMISKNSIISVKDKKIIVEDLTEGELVKSVVPQELPA